MRDSKRLSINRIGLYVGVVAGAAIMLFPFLWTVVTSITPEGSLSGGPTLLVKNPTLNAYRALMDAMPMWRIIANSLGVAVVSTGLQLITGSMAGYGFGRLQFRGKNVLKQAVEGVPRELDEAATLDGAGHLRIFTMIVLPLIRPALATVAVFAFMGSWNSFLWPLVVIRSPEFMTLPLGLSTLQGQFTTRWDVVMAGSVVSVIPIAIVYLLAQRHIIAGVATTGIK